MSDVEFRLLGPLEVRIRGKTAWVPSKQQIVLYALLTAGGNEVTLGRLADAVWDEPLPRTACKQVRNAVSSLRNVFNGTRPRIVLSPNGYLLDTADAAVDLPQFLEHVASARQHDARRRSVEAIAAYRAALSLWRGQAELPGGSRVAHALVASLNEQRLAVLEECIGLELGCGRHTHLVSELHAWVAIYPLREHLVGQLIVALYRSGARAQAFEVYQRTRRLLAGELGLNPGTGLEDIHRRMLTDDLALSWTDRPVIPCLRHPRTPSPAMAGASSLADQGRVGHAEEREI